MPTFNWPVIGHQKIVNYLQKIAASGTPNHAYLFYGASGLGKNLVADLFVQSLLCYSPNTKPCGTCANCRQLSQGIHPDVINLTRAEDEKNISVESVRQARQAMQNSSWLKSYKIIMVREADTLSIGAANALLKILEEPFGQTVFIFIAEDLKFLPRTILSRLQVIKFLPVKQDEMEQYFLANGLELSLARDLASFSLGFPGRVLPWVEHPKQFREHQVKLASILQTMSGHLNERLRLAEELAGQNNSESSKLHVREFLNSLISLLRDVLLIKGACQNRIAHRSLENNLTSFAEHYPAARLAKVLSETRLTLRLLDQNVNLRLALENLILSF